MPNSPMLDLHCHYLPGVDDGARTLADGIALVRASVANGISRIVLTPHVHPGRYDNRLQSLKPRFEAFRRAVASAHIPVQLALASEARLCDELLPLLERDEVPLFEAADGARSLLLELPHNHIPAGSTAFIRWLLRRNITPLIAHPERNKELMAHPQRLQQLRAAGCGVQVTAGAIVGGFGARAQQTAYLFLDNGWVDIIASDAHNLRHRPPLMREARALLTRRYGEGVASELCVTAPLARTAGNFADAGMRKPASAAPRTETAPPPEAIKETREAGISFARNTAPPPRNDVCESALDRMRSKLLQRAAEPNGRGAKAARILELMNTLQAR